MPYCSKCQRLTENTERCPSCGNGNLREVRADDPVLLLSVGETDADAVRAAFDDAGVPHEERMAGPGAPPALLYGKSPIARYRIFVRYGDLEQARDLLLNIGVPAEGGGETERGQNRVRLVFSRIVASLLFLGIVAAVVVLADGLIGLLKSALR